MNHVIELKLRNYKSKLTSSIFTPKRAVTRDIFNYQRGTLVHLVLLGGGEKLRDLRGKHLSYLSLHYGWWGSPVGWGGAQTSREPG